MVDHVRIKIKYEIPSYIVSLTTVCHSDACYYPLRSTSCVVNSYTSELQKVVMSRYTRVTHILFYK